MPVRFHPKQKQHQLLSSSSSFSSFLFPLSILFLSSAGLCPFISIACPSNCVLASTSLYVLSLIFTFSLHFILYDDAAADDYNSSCPPQSGNLKSGKFQGAWPPREKIEYWRRRPILWRSLIKWKACAG